MATWMNISSRNPSNRQYRKADRESEKDTSIDRRVLGGQILPHISLIKYIDTLKKRNEIAHAIK